jgi:pyridoxamine 5'-phosphate oxidase
MPPPETIEEINRLSLSETDLDPDPIRQFRRWFGEVVTAGLREPGAMTLATVGPDGQPSARMVLLKGFDDRGFTFHTNYEGRKARDLASNPQAALLFFWHPLERQVRIEGTVERLSEAESDDYFRTRPLGSQLSAWASPQSEVVASREGLERRVRELARQYEGREVPRPPFWGGLRLQPKSLEFWQGGLDRLHDRLRYRRAESGGWIIERLAP